MNANDDRKDGLLEAYRRAGDTDAGRPAEATRRAILEGARAEARRRQPAANDSRYAWSAVAGIAVLGIAVLLWRQADPRTEVTAVVTAAKSVSAERLESAARPAAPSPPDEGARKLRELFPDAWASNTPPAIVWIIEGADGLPLRQGTLAEGEALPQLSAPQFAAEAARSAGLTANDAAGSPASAAPAWTVQTTVNGAGIPVRIATAREPMP